MNPNTAFSTQLLKLWELPYSPKPTPLWSGLWMASSHRHCNCCRSHIPTSSTATATSCCCSIDFSSPLIHSCKPPPFPTDQLLQVIASCLLQSNHNLTNCQPHQTEFQTHEVGDRHKYQSKLEKKSLHQQEHHRHSLIASLLCRIEALESSFHHYQRYGSYSLRDSAARIIQTHFRAFLVRRSRTLSQLKELALIRSSFNSLKSSISSETDVNFGALPYKAMDLLLKIDFIQGNDLMVKDARRSIIRDLVRLLDFVDGVVVKRHGISVKTAKDNFKFGKKLEARALGSTRPAGFDSKQNKALESLRKRVERNSRLTKLSENAEEVFDLEGIEGIMEDFDEDRRKNGATLIHNGIQGGKNGTKPKVKRSVSFADNGNKLYEIRRESGRNNCSSGLDVRGSSDGGGEFVENHDREAVEEVRGTFQRSDDDEYAISHNGGSSEVSDEDSDSRSDTRNEARSVNDQKHNGKLVFSAPLPVKMEPRADLTGQKL